MERVDLRLELQSLSHSFFILIGLNAYAARDVEPLVIPSNWTSKRPLRKNGEREKRKGPQSEARGFLKKQDPTKGRQKVDTSEISDQDLQVFYFSRSWS